MVLGILAGYVCNSLISPEAAKEAAGYFAMVTDIFLRLVKMIIAPLVFSTLVAGLAGMGDAGTVGRIGGKAVGWFLMASLVSLTIGLIFANLLQPGANVGVPLPDAGVAAGLKTSALNLKDFVTHVFPRNFFEAMANNEILQILVFSVFVGLAVGPTARHQGPHAGPGHRGSGAGDAEGHRLRHALRPDRRVRRRGERDHHAGAGRAAGLRQVHRQLLPDPRRAVGRADRRRLAGAEEG